MQKLYLILINHYFLINQVILYNIFVNLWLAKNKPLIFGATTWTEFFEQWILFPHPLKEDQE